MTESMNPSLVRIRTADERVVGAGFLVGESQILTCAHVIAEALGLTDISSDPPLTPIMLDFPLLTPDMRPVARAARVICWCPPDHNGCCDIAGLTLLGDPPVGSRTIRFTSAEDVWGHPFRAFGFPAGYDDGAWASGRLLSRQAANWLQIEDVKTEGFAVVPGFSGGPVWDDQLQGVVGMVVAASRRTEMKAAFVIPFDVLATVWPLLQPMTYQRVFLSTAPADKTFAQQLRADLQAQEIMVWDDTHGPVQNEIDAQERVRQAIKAAQAVLLVVSSQTRTSRTVRGHRLLADYYQRRLILIKKGDSESTSSPATDWQDTVWVDAQNIPYETTLKNIEAALSQQPSRTNVLEPLPEELEQEPRNPYKGLHPFTADDVEDFFGRERLVRDLVNDVSTLFKEETPGAESERCLTIIGPSGSGKSSLVMAGLLPQLQRGALPESDTWVYLEPMRPGKHPIEALMLTLKSHFIDRGLKALHEDLEDDTTQGLHLLAKDLVKGRKSKVVLLIDQFEEVFTQTETEDERRRFIDLLLTAATAPCGPLLVLLTMRADFYDRPMDYLALSRLMQAHQRLVLPMDIEDLRATIERPAALPGVRLSFEGNLVGDLLFEMHGQIGALPLLQFTLDQLYEQREGRRLTLQAYHELGGVKGAISCHAEKTYAALPSEEHRYSARVLFLRLLELGASDQEITRRRVAQTELEFDDPKQTQLMRQTINAFIKARLLTASEVAGTKILEVSHEAVLREWKRIAEWLLEERGDILIRQELSKSAAEWEQHGRPRDRLYRRSQLKEVQEWAKRNSSRLSERETAFLHACTSRQNQWHAGVIFGGFLLALGIFIAAWSIFFRATLVTNTEDDGLGSLRYCIENAQNGATIRFAPWVHGTIHLTGPLSFPSGKQLTIQGPGADDITISGGKKTYATIQVPPVATVTISNLNFQDSKTAISAFILNEGTLNLNNSTISGNTTEANVVSFGGGIYNAGNLTVKDSIIANNSSTGDERGYGGGIFNQGNLTVENSKFEGNQAGSNNGGNGLGGGITNYKRGRVWVDGSTFSKNKASGNEGFGGGIFNFNTGTATVTNSTFSDNSASVKQGAQVASGEKGAQFVKGEKGAEGGGIDNEGNLTVVNGTFSRNSAEGGSKHFGGGGISFVGLQGSSTIIRFCTFYANASSAGGGIWVDPTGSGQLTVSDTIIEANRAHDGPNLSGILKSDGYNWTDDRTGVRGLTGMDRQVTRSDLNLESTLKKNGGPVPTLKLLPGSKAIDAVPGDICQKTFTDPFGQTEKVTTDERGNPRPGKSDNACDIGAYESSY